MNEAEAQLAQVQAHLAAGRHLIDSMSVEMLERHAEDMAAPMTRLLRTMQELQEIIDRGEA